MEPLLLQKLADKKITKETLRNKVASNFDLLPDIFHGVYSPIAAVRYGCASVLVDLSATYPEKLYPYMDEFVALLGGKHRILTWNATAAIANLCCVDNEKRFDLAFDKYFGLLNDEYLVTVANVVGNAGKIALAKPHLIARITAGLLRVEDHPTTPHLTEECKRVLCEATLDSFSLFFSMLDPNDRLEVLAFARRCLNSPRKTLFAKAELFLRQWSRV